MAAAILRARLLMEDLEDTGIREGDPTTSIIERVVAEVRPTIVYTHSVNDIHQDHRNTHSATMVAARSVPYVLCFQSPSATISFRPSRFVSIEHTLDRKMDAIAAFASQASTPRVPRRLPAAGKRPVLGAVRGRHRGRAVRGRAGSSSLGAHRPRDIAACDVGRADRTRRRWLRTGRPRRTAAGRAGAGARDGRGRPIRRRHHPVAGARAAGRAPRRGHRPPRRGAVPGRRRAARIAAPR